MVAYRERDGLEPVVRLISSLAHEVREENHRYSVLAAKLIFFVAIFISLVMGETLFAAMMFAILQIEVLGTIFSGAAFALLVPTMIGAAHVKLHHEGDIFTKWWLSKLSSIGILIFALGLSLMVGYSAWLAAQDAMSFVSNVTIGTIGGEIVGDTGGGNSGIAEWLGVIPSSLLFLGLSFGMIITIYFASFCVGEALQAFNTLTQTPRIGDDVKVLIEELTAKIAAFRKLHNAGADARRKLPFDIKSKFAREAANAGWKVMQIKLSAARTHFDPAAQKNPLTLTVRDPVAETIPTGFKTEEDYTRHLAEQMDVLRQHNMLRVLTGLPTDNEEDK